jgi:NADP-dependent alcohol dehydrogenase
MQNFTFYNPTKILFGKGQIANLAKEIPGSAGADHLRRAAASSKTAFTPGHGGAEAGYTVFEFAGIEPNPTYETLMNAVRIVREERIDFLLAVGGGSVIDGTKFIAAAALFEGEPWDILAKHAPITRRCRSERC